MVLQSVLAALYQIEHRRARGPGNPYHGWTRLGMDGEGQDCQECQDCQDRPD